MRSIMIAFCLFATLSGMNARAEDCSAAATQAAMNDCANTALKNTDAELNAIYRDLIGRLKNSEDSKQALIVAQRAWLQFRDGECAFAASAVSGGSIYPTIVANCRNALTADRVKALGVYLNCAEGDMACPVPPK
ncbi:lysozyme inhibitor LprI family protein [Methylocella silvestris]|uniref:Urease-associated protein n=1 Tax=Methylocella silvestris TaxID=199596 RepID=A0A2J7TJG1_METSI|nr:lysozyme inhibitor LprI family protein [Methylocella silvestris]PNG26867.1 urease-associated protein [Methylocella silvestris]